MTTDNIIDNVAKLKRAWALVFSEASLPPGDAVFYRWLCFFPMRDIEVAFQRVEQSRRHQNRELSLTQIQNRIQDTLYIMKNKRRGR